MNKLNLGCGTDYREGWANVDIDPNVKTDWGGDACKMPFGRHKKFSQGQWEFDHIYAHHSLEHFPDLFIIVDEMARVSEDWATWEIITPYCTWIPGWGNPHHHILFHENTFRFFDKGENGIHKRREQDYSIETVRVEYGWNDKLIHDIGAFTGTYGAVDIDPGFFKDKFLNVVREITFHLKVHK